MAHNHSMITFTSSSDYNQHIRQQAAARRPSTESMSDRRARQMREFHAKQAAEYRARCEAERAAPIWEVREQWGVYSFAGDFYGWEVRRADPKKGGKSYAECEAEIAAIKAANPKRVKIAAENGAFWSEFINF